VDTSITDPPQYGFYRFDPMYKPFKAVSSLFSMFAAALISLAILVGTIVLTIDSIIDGNRRGVFIPLCGLPVFIQSTLMELGVLSAFIATEAEIRLNREQGIELYFLGFWYLVPWRYFRQARLVEDSPRNIRDEVPGRKQYKVGVPYGLSFFHKANAVVNLILGHVREWPYFVLRPDHADYDMIIAYIRQQISEGSR
jgi:hypothetical protein